MSGLEVEHITRQDGKTFVYRLRGVLGESTYSFDFLEELRRQVKEGPERIVLNLADLEYITSSGVGIIAAAYTSARRAGKTLCLVNVPSKVQRVLDICGVFDAVSHYDSEDEAASAT
jgi:anti-sigma B factor antagonist